MPKARSLSRSVLVQMLLLIIAAVGVLGALWVAGEYQQFRGEAEQLRELLLRERRILISTHVRDTVRYAEYMRAQTEQRARDAVRTQVLEAHAVATQLAERFADRPREEVAGLVREALRRVRFNEGRGYFFATRLDGVEQLFADRPELEGKNLLDMTDTQGHLVIRDMIQLVRQQGEGFYEYTWTRPEAPGRDYRKVSFIKYFEPLDWFIGTGEYLADMEAQVQREVLRRLESERWEDDGYIFAGRWDGFVLTGPAPGKNLWEATDKDGVKVVQELVRLAREGGGFLRYTMPPASGEAPRSKLSYVLGIPEWQWYVGTGVYIDDIEATVAAGRAALDRRVLVQGGRMALVLVALLGAGLVLSFRSARQTREAFERFARFFSQAAGGAARVDPDALRYHEFRELANAANHMVESRDAAARQLAISEERMELALDAAQIGFWDWNVATGETYFSPRYLSMLGYGANELPHSFETWRDLLHPDDFVRVEPQLQAAISEDRPWRLEFRMRSKAGGYRIIVGNGRIVERAEDGAPLRATGTHLDVTERHQEEQRFRAVVDAAPWGMHIYRLETDGRLVFTGANRAADHILGVDHQEFLGKTLEEAFPPLADTEIPGIYRRLAADGGAWNSEQVDYEHEAIRGAFEVHAFQPSPGQVAVAFVDVTERRRHEAERARLEEQLRQSQKLEAIGTLAGGIAHDFNNILSAISGYSELAKYDTPAGSRSQGYLDNVLTAADRAKQLVQQILAFSRTSEQKRLLFQPHLVVEEALGLLSATIPKSIEIRSAVDPDSGGVVGDPAQLHQVVVNLCTNAYQAMRESGGTLQVRLEPVEVDRAVSGRVAGLSVGPHVKLSVADTGPGMDQATRERIFEPFFTTKPVGEGTGMGLAVVHGIVRTFGGVLLVDSAPGRGATFTVYLPRREAGVGSVDSTDEAALDRGTEHILFVDDEEMLANLGRSLLGSLGYRVTATQSPAEALEWFRAAPEAYDLLVTDQTMPGINGDQLATRVLELRPDLPVLICTGYSDVLDEERALQLGVRALLMKPLTRHDLGEAVRAALAPPHAPPVAGQDA